MTPSTLGRHNYSTITLIPFPTLHNGIPPLYLYKINSDETILFCYVELGVVLNLMEEIMLACEAYQYIFGLVELLEALALFNDITTAIEADLYSR